MSVRTPVLVVGALALAVSLTACGSKDSTGSAASGASSAGVNPEGGRFSGGPGGDPTEFQAIQACLQAAGLGADLPSGNPSGGPSGNPSDQPSFNASDRPTGAPSGGPGGGFGQVFSDPEVQAALKACGITLPTGGPAGAASGSPSAGG